MQHASGLIGPKRAAKARSAVLTSEARRAERAEMLFFFATVLAEETFEFLGEFVA